MLRAVIVLRGIRKLPLHGDAQTPPVLDGIDLTIAAGETCGLCGPGAAGKSLLLRVLCGLVRPDAGSVEVAGTRMDGQDPRALREAQARIGMLFQNNALFDSLTVFDNVAFPLRQRAIQSGQDDQAPAIAARAAEALRGVGLAEHADKPPSALSGGQRKRVALARAVAVRPQLVIYDEPTAGLDPVTTAKIYDLLRREREAASATVLVVSSDLDALRAFAPRLLMLYRGRLRYDGPSDAAADADDPVVRQFVRGELEGPL